MRQDFLTMPPGSSQARARTIIMPGNIVWKADANGKFWETTCPHCKRGILFQFKTAHRPAAVRCQLSKCGAWTEAP